MAEDVDDALRRLLEGESKTTPMLSGEARKEFDDDWESGKSPTERGAIINRWHDKGYVFPSDLRQRFLAGGADESTRAAWRAMFDEQDQRSGHVPPKVLPAAPQDGDR